MSEIVEQNSVESNAVESHRRMERLEQFVKCPREGGALRWTGQGMRCDSCGADFAASPQGILDLRPPQPSFSDDGDYGRRYRQALADPSGAAGVPWGTAESLSALDLTRKRRHIAAVRSLLDAPVSRPSTLCDLSGGAGHYTLAFADLFDYVFHCDLDPSSLRYTQEKASALGYKNIYFIRADYFRPPFAASLDRALCLDTLIRGPEHEVRLLRCIGRILADDGAAVVDFHNWWHNPLRRLGLLKENFGRNSSYARRELDAMLSSAGLTRLRYVPFRQETSKNSLLTCMIPPTRMVFSVSVSK